MFERYLLILIFGLKAPGMPQRPQMMKLLERMVEAKILKILVAGSGRRAAVYSLHELVRACDSGPPA
jgi:hypothetical protein